MAKYDVRVDNDTVQVKTRQTSDGSYTTIVENKSDRYTETYTSIHEGEGRNTHVHTHYSDGSSWTTVLDDKGNCVNQYSTDQDGNKHDQRP